MEGFPLLDIQESLAEVDRHLQDIVYYVRLMQADSNATYPPDAAALLANVTTIRELLAGILTSGQIQALAAEQAAWDAQAELYD